MRRFSARFGPIVVVAAAICLGLNIPLDIIAAPGGFPIYLPQETLREIAENLTEADEDPDKQPPTPPGEKTYHEAIVTYHTERVAESNGEGNGTVPSYPDRDDFPTP